MAFKIPILNVSNLHKMIMEQRMMLLKEFSALRLLKDSGVVPRAFSHAIGPFTVLELEYFGMDLFDFVKSDHARFVQNFEFIRQQTMNAVKTLQNAQILHNDVKLDNFLIDPATLKVKIIDFGLCYMHSFVF